MSETPEQTAKLIVAQWKYSMGQVVKYEQMESDIAAALYVHREEALELAARTCEYDSVLDWVGGSTGNAKGTARRIARAIRDLKTT